MSTRREMLSPRRWQSIPGGQSAFVSLYRTSRVYYRVAGVSEEKCIVVGHTAEGDMLPVFPFPRYDGRVGDFERIEFRNLSKSVAWLDVEVRQVHADERDTLDLTPVSIELPGGAEEGLTVAQLVKKELGRYGMSLDHPGDADDFLDADEKDDMVSAYTEMEDEESLPWEQSPDNEASTEPGAGASKEASPAPEEGDAASDEK